MLTTRPSTSRDPRIQRSCRAAASATTERAARAYSPTFYGNLDKLIEKDVEESLTDHLDSVNTAWLQNYVKECSQIVRSTSQPKETLNVYAAHITQFKRLKLNECRLGIIESYH